MDNMTLWAAWENGSCRSSLANQELKKIEEMSRAGNFALKLKYIPSNKNIADAPFHTLSDIDCSLSEEAWARVQARFGPHLLTCLDVFGQQLLHRKGWPVASLLAVFFTGFFCMTDTDFWSILISLINSLTLSVKTQLKKFTRWQMNAATTSHNHLLCQGAISLHNNFHLDPSIVTKSKR